MSGCKHHNKQQEYCDKCLPVARMFLPQNGRNNFNLKDDMPQNGRNNFILKDDKPENLNVKLYQTRKNIQLRKERKLELQKQQTDELLMEVILRDEFGF